MNFWENLGETISVKGKEVAGKAKDMTDIASLKGQVATCQNTISKNYKEIGKAFYEAHKDVETAEYAEQMSAIRDAKQTVDELEKKIRAIKGTKHCNACGEDVSKDSVYCPKCGVKMEDEFYDEDGDTTELKDIISEEDIVD